jgi:beta-lactamase regulating signal transducer with metallopeptidase domain
MAQFLLYSLAVAAALTAAGHAFEHIRPWRGVPRRLMWLVFMSASIAIPLVATLARPPHAPPTEKAVALVATPANAAARESGQTPHTAGRRAVAGAVLTAEDSAPGARAALVPASGAPGSSSEAAAGTAAWSWPFAGVPDSHVLRAWMALTASVCAYLVVATVLLRRRRATWARAQLDEEEVFISPDAGPALIGVFRPRIVVPQWFFDEPASSQALILAHERQHRCAGDPLLLRAALLAVALVPWNLPLWWQWQRLRTAIELDCDARVMRAGSSPGDYGAVLLRVAQATTMSPVGAISMGLPASALEQRILHLAEIPPRRSSLVRTLAATLLAFAGTALAVTMEAPALLAHAGAPATAMPAAELLPAARDEDPATAPAGTSQAADIVASGQPAAVPPTNHMGAAAPAPTAQQDVRVVTTENAAEIAFDALLRAHPELLASQHRDGWYSAAVVLRPDGSVFRSGLRYADDRSRAYRDILDLRYLPAVSLDPRNAARPAAAGSQTFIELRRAGDAGPDGRVLPNHLIFLYGVLPAGYDEQRSLLPVWEGVLARHSELLLPREAAFANSVTLLMSEDGRIAREVVELGTREDILRRAPDFTQLGIREQDIGVRGTTTLTRNDYSEVDEAPLDQQLLRAALWSAMGVRDELIVHYAWPRRRDEPAGGWPAPTSSYGERPLTLIDGRSAR